MQRTKSSPCFLSSGHQYDKVIKAASQSSVDPQKVGEYYINDRIHNFQFSYPKHQKRQNFSPSEHPQQEERKAQNVRVNTRFALPERILRPKITFHHSNETLDQSPAVNAMKKATSYADKISKDINSDKGACGGFRVRKSPKKPHLHTFQRNKLRKSPTFIKATFETNHHI